jgi:hypothetical protein
MSSDGRRLPVDLNKKSHQAHKNSLCSSRNRGFVMFTIILGVCVLTTNLLLGAVISTVLKSNRTSAEINKAGRGYLARRSG